MIRLGPGNKGLLGSGAHRAGGGKIRLGDDPIRARGLLAAELQRLFQLSYGSLLRLDLFPEKALTGLEVERSVSGISCSQERRSPGWRLEDPSRGFLAPRRGAHRAGEALTGLEAGRSVSRISCSQERRSPGWRWKDPSRGFLAPLFSAHRAGGGKIRLGDFLLPKGAHRVGGWKIRLGDFLLPEEALTGLRWKDPSGISCSQKRRSPGWRRKDPSRR